MKYILVFVVWSALQGGAPATAEFDDAEACKFAANDIKTKLNKNNQPATWLVTCYPKISQEKKE